MIPGVVAQILVVSVFKNKYFVLERVNIPYGSAIICDVTVVHGCLHTSFSTICADVCLQPGEIEALLLHKGGENGHAAGDATAEDVDKPANAPGPKFGWIIGVFVSFRCETLRLVATCRRRPSTITQCCAKVWNTFK